MMLMMWKLRQKAKKKNHGLMDLEQRIKYVFINEINYDSWMIMESTFIRTSMCSSFWIFETLKFTADVSASASARTVLTQMKQPFKPIYWLFIKFSSFQLPIAALNNYAPSSFPFHFFCYCYSVLFSFSIHIFAIEWASRTSLDTIHTHKTLISSNCKRFQSVSRQQRKKK